MTIAHACRNWLIAGAASVAVGTLAVACGSDPGTPAPVVDAGTNPEDVVVPPVSDAALDAIATCIPIALDCSGKCGKITDPCSGASKQCGLCAPLVNDAGVAQAQACDLVTNTCGTPKLTCLDLGAECGKVKNSCGEYKDCPACTGGKECDPDTNKCKECTQVSCQDLGFECGDAWLGCGDPADPSTHSNCGDCSGNAGKPRCNSAFNVCEPACVPKSAKEICDAAKAKSGVQCGNISDGCGGIVNCSAVAGYGCPAGQSCGVRGIANRCDKYEPAAECSLAGRNCNPADPTKQLKSACTNAVLDCGSCTAPEVCNDNGVCGPPCKAKTCADVGNPQCGSFDDGCKGTLTCGPCPAGQTCKTATNTCCVAKTCAIDYPGQCGTGFDNGCGGKLDCGICNATTQKCTMDGAATATPVAGVAGKCCTKKTCAADYAGQCGLNLSDGCGGVMTCGTCVASGLCTVSNGAGGQRQTTAGEVGTCCARNACTSCTDIADNCRAVGTTIDCAGFKGCGVGLTCGGTAKDMCCALGACGVTAGKANCAAVTNTCGTNACKCTGAGESCVTTYPGAAGASVCCAKATCGTSCGTNLPDNCGGMLTNCPCAAGKTCSSSTSGVAGTCACPIGTPYTCANVPGKQANDCGTYDNGCGGVLNCTCTTSGNICNKAAAAPSGTCCQPLACPAVPAVGSACGVLDNGCGGVTANCTCPNPPESRFMCTNKTCQCTPLTAGQCGTRTGVIPDGCGSFVNCGG